MEHSLFSPSAVDAWKKSGCPAYVLHNKGGKPNIHMSTGTSFHTIIEDYYKHNCKLSAHLGQIYEVDGFEVEVTQEMIDHAEFNISAVDEFREKNPDAEMVVEEKVSLESYGFPEVFGTPDVKFLEIFGNLIIIDHKYGRGKTVYADSGQLKLYLVMAAGKMLKTFDELITVILQPRDVHGEKIKIAYHDADELLEWLETEVVAAVNDVNSGNPTYRPSLESCRWCNYKGKCKAQADFAMQLINQDIEGIPDLVINEFRPKDSKELTPVELSRILKHEKFLTNWIDSVKAVATEKLVRGEEIPEFKIVESITHRRWNPDLDIEHILYKECQIRKKDMLTKKLKTPTAILDMIGNKNPETVKRIEELIIRPQGNPKLAHVTDRREAMECSIDKDLEGVNDLKG